MTTLQQEQANAKMKLNKLGKTKRVTKLLTKEANAEATLVVRSLSRLKRLNKVRLTELILKRVRGFKI